MQHQTTHHPTSLSRPALLLRPPNVSAPEQRAPIGNGVKDLRPLTRAPEWLVHDLRALGEDAEADRWQAWIDADRFE